MTTGDPDCHVAEVGRRSREKAAQELAELWRRALNPILHGTGCGCCSNPGLVLRADWLEEDLLDYLEGRYRADASNSLLTVVRRRAAVRGGGLIVWLAGLERDGLNDAEAQRLRDDVATTLKSMTRSHGYVDERQQ